MKQYYLKEYYKELPDEIIDNLSNTELDKKTGLNLPKDQFAFIEKVIRNMQIIIETEKKKAVEKLKLLQEGWDTEMAHGRADDVLCDLLKEIGYIEVVEEYKKIEKWYG